MCGLVLISEEERARRKASVDYARASIELEGFVLDADIEALNQRYIDGELTRAEFTAEVKRALGMA